MFERITVDPRIMCGKPVIRGTRIPVYLVVNLVAAGYSLEKIREAYPNLQKEDVEAALRFAGSLANYEEQELPPEEAAL
ncbi:MAG: DUF433 domain-containing protein [Bacillota bacterium]|nr:DUF433 domain-containing protein [Thermoanaerobacteraceae bacterium]